MGLVLVSVCFRYKTNALLAYMRDAKKIANLCGYTRKILLTDTNEQFQEYDEVIRCPTTEQFINVVKDIEDIENTIVLYITGHGIVSGFLWHDSSILEIQPVLDSIYCNLFAIIDACNAPAIDFPFVFDNTNWIFGRGPIKNTLQLVFMSSSCGINSKMSNNGSIYTTTVALLLEGNYTMQNVIKRLSFEYKSGRVYSTTPCWKTLEAFNAILRKSV